MKTCQNCGSISFDDMEMCFDCMNSFVEPVSEDTESYEQSVARLKVVLIDYFSYELLLHKLEGRSLSVGSDTNNAIVIPLEEVAPHQLEVFYAHGHVWVEAVDPSLEVMVSEIPLAGKACIEPGNEIKLGNACITLLDA